MASKDKLTRHLSNTSAANESTGGGESASSFRQTLPLISWFLSSTPLKGDSQTEGVGVRSADQLAMTFLIITVYLCSIVGLFITTIYLVSITVSQTLLLYVIVTQTLSLFLLITSLLTFKYLNKSVSFLGNAYAGAIFFNIVCSILLMGFSFSSPNLPLLIFVPTWAFMVCGQKEGFSWTIMVTVTFLLIYVVQPLAIDFPQIVASDYLDQARLSAWILGLCLVTLCSYSYQRNFTALNNFLEKEKERFAYQAQHDSLTGLANRALFHKRVEEALQFAKGEKVNAGLIYIDLNDFKIVNDNLGHHAGDKVLKIAGDRIRSSIRSSDTAARLGGDEFGVVLHGLSNTEVLTNVARVIERELTKPILVMGKEITIGGSLGTSIAPEHGTNVDDIIRHADTAMYRSKNLVKNMDS